MRRLVFAIGLVLILAGVFVLDQGVQILTPVAESFGLATRVRTDTSLMGPTLITVPSSNYTFLSADLNGGAEIKGSLQVVDAREIAVYVMNGENFNLWQSGRPCTVILAKPVVVSYNFTVGA